MLSKYFLINVAPVLLIEIIGDLSKPQEEGRTPEQVVTALARKLPRANLHYNVHHMTLLKANILGYEFEMAGRPIGKAIMTTEINGSRGGIITETPDEQALSRWKDGNFIKSDYTLADEYRQFIESIDLVGIRDLRAGLQVAPPFKQVSDIVNFVDNIEDNKDINTRVLKAMIETLVSDLETAQHIFLRWEQGNHRSLKDFAPYAHQYFRLTQIFFIGIASELITTRTTNQIDFEYLWYQPFCDIFVSSDKLHKSIAPALCRSYQNFVDGELLKHDLSSLVAEWQQNFNRDMKKWDEKYGKEPPPNSHSITYRLWKKYFLDRKPGVDGMVERIDDPNVEFIEKRQYISPEEPCPCGSGKPLKDCCLEKSKGKNTN